MTTWVAPLPEAAGPKERPQRAGARAARRRRRGRQRHAAPRRRAPSYCGQPTAAAAAWACSPPVFGRAAWCWPARAAAHASESAVAMSVETRGFWREQAHQDAGLSQGSKRVASSLVPAQLHIDQPRLVPVRRRSAGSRKRESLSASTSMVQRGAELNLDIAQQRGPPAAPSECRDPALQRRRRGPTRSVCSNFTATRRPEDARIGDRNAPGPMVATPDHGDPRLQGNFAGTHT